MLKDRAKLVDDKGTVDAAAVSKSNKHVVVVVDDPDAPSALVRRIAARDGVTVIAYRHGDGPDRDYVVHPRELLLRMERSGHSADAPLKMDHWHNFRWQMFCAEPDTLDTQIVRHLARQLSKWDSAPIGRQDAGWAAAQTMLSLLGITNAANLDVHALWQPRLLPVGTGEPVDLEPLLKVPIGLQPSGAPLIVDLKDEADGGNGPHGLMIGMTGSGKSTALATLVEGFVHPALSRRGAGDPHRLQRRRRVRRVRRLPPRRGGHHQHGGKAFSGRAFRRYAAGPARPAGPDIP